MDSAKLGTSFNNRKADIAPDIGVRSANIETVDAWSCLNA